MGYHIVHRLTRIPAIAKDGGTGSWRDAKKVLRQWYLSQAASLRAISEKSYFQSPTATWVVDEADSASAYNQQQAQGRESV